MVTKVVQGIGLFQTQIDDDQGEVYTRERRGCLTVTLREAVMEMVSCKGRLTTRRLPDQTRPNCDLGVSAGYRAPFRHPSPPPCSLQGRDLIHTPAGDDPSNVIG